MRRRSRKIYAFGLLSPTTRSPNRLDWPVLSYQLLFAKLPIAGLPITRSQISVNQRSSVFISGRLLPFRSPDHPISRSPDPWLFGSRAMSRDDVAPRRFPPLCHLERSRSACDGAVERSMHFAFLVRPPDHPIGLGVVLPIAICQLPVAAFDHQIIRSPDHQILDSPITKPALESRQHSLPQRDFIQHRTRCVLINQPIKHRLH